jgi:glycosyltransferase involved in cell wall biosynthesis
LVKNLFNFFPENNYYLYTPRFKNDPETEYFLSHNEIRTFIPEVILKSFWRSFSILNQLKNDKIELFHGLSHEIPYGIRRTGIKTVVTIHDLIFETYPETYPFIDRIIYRWKFKYACKTADRIVAISESTKRDIVKYFNIDESKIDVVYQACNSLFLTPQPAEVVSSVVKQYNLPSEYLLYVGSVIERKNLVTLIDAYAYLSDETKLPLVVIGKGKRYMDMVKSRIKESNLEDKVIWIDNLSDNNHLQAIYQMASIFIYPSLYEGFGIPIIEALLCRTPVITSNRSSLPEAGGPSTFYFDPYDAQQLANGINTILNDAEYRNQMVESGFRYAVETFDGKAVTEKLIEVYKKVLS